MKRTIYVITGLAALVATGYLIYKKATRKSANVDYIVSHEGSKILVRTSSIPGGTFKKDESVKIKASPYKGRFKVVSNPSYASGGSYVVLNTKFISTGEKEGDRDANKGNMIIHN